MKLSLSLFVLMLFYDLLRTMIYYLIQPFSSEMGIRSPAFKVFSVLEQFTVFIFLFVKFNLLDGLPILLGLMLLMALITHLGVYRFGEKRFRLHS